MQVCFCVQLRSKWCLLCSAVVTLCGARPYFDKLPSKTHHLSLKVFNAFVKQDNYFQSISWMLKTLHVPRPSIWLPGMP